MPEKFDPDERFSLHPLEGEKVIIVPVSTENCLRQFRQRHTRR